ncbi:hypothetical protein PG990_013047 [Apiospora arundinis]
MAPLINSVLALTPTRALPSLLTRTLHPRQATATIITTGVQTEEVHETTLSGGAIAGIVIGSIVGFLLICWIIRSCCNLGRPGIWGYTFGAKDDPRPERLPTSTLTARRHIAPGRAIAVITTIIIAIATATVAAPAASRSRSARSRPSVLLRATMRPPALRVVAAVPRSRLLLTALLKRRVM